MANSNSTKRTTARALILGIFLILFGLGLGVATYLTVVGPIFGLLLVGFGIYIIWTSAAHGEPPKPVS